MNVRITIYFLSLLLVAGCGTPKDPYPFHDITSAELQEANYHKTNDLRLMGKKWYFPPATQTNPPPSYE